jgi:signal peptidase I
MNLSLRISEALLRNGVNVRITTRGSSMFPLLRTGDRITISPDTHPEIGDMVVFRRNGAMVCHRLVKIFEKDRTIHYQTRGDTVSRVDDPIPQRDLLGKVIRIDMMRLSLARRILLLINPGIRRGRLNRVLVPALMKMRKTLS